MVPCCLKIISCDEYLEILEDLEANGPMFGGAIGKHISCPKDAAQAQQLASGKQFYKNYIIEYSTELLHIRIYSGMKVNISPFYSR